MNGGNAPEIFRDIRPLGVELRCVQPHIPTHHVPSAGYVQTLIVTVWWLASRPTARRSERSTRLFDDKLATLKGWQLDAVKDWINTPMTLAEIGTKYGRSKNTVACLVSRLRITKQVEAKRVTIYGKPLSPGHRSLGLRLTIYRGHQTMSGAAKQLGVTPNLLKAMEMGSHDFRLSELQRIAVVLGRSIDQLITPAVIDATPPRARQ